MGLPAGCGQPQRNFGQQYRFQRQLLVGLVQQQQQRVQRELQRFEPQPAEQQQPLQRVRGAFGACDRELFFVFISRDGACTVSMCLLDNIYAYSGRFAISPYPYSAALRRFASRHYEEERRSNPVKPKYVTSRRYKACYEPMWRK